MPAACLRRAHHTTSLLPVLPKSSASRHEDVHPLFHRTAVGPVHLARAPQRAKPSSSGIVRYASAVGDQSTWLRRPFGQRLAMQGHLTLLISQAFPFASPIEHVLATQK